MLRVVLASARALQPRAVPARPGDKGPPHRERGRQLPLEGGPGHDESKDAMHLVIAAHDRFATFRMTS